ncbi:unnamed protein product [Paramecium sonneborni]|uniref:Uncharacterized protein n=1 Tax=Paramecium sonneborni TaxID=65129 RepID=A0A8S1PTJ1_9CILI|nr:unnamed protein product [Paramecium sonneborni]
MLRYQPTLLIRQSKSYWNKERIFLINKSYKLAYEEKYKNFTVKLITNLFLIKKKILNVKIKSRLQQSYKKRINYKNNKQKIWFIDFQKKLQEEFQGYKTQRLYQSILQIRESFCSCSIQNKKFQFNLNFQKTRITLHSAHDDEKLQLMNFSFLAISKFVPPMINHSIIQRILPKNIQ